MIKAVILLLQFTFTAYFYSLILQITFHLFQRGDKGRYITKSLGDVLLLLSLDSL